MVPRHSATNTPHMDTPHMDTPHTGHMPYSTQAILKQVHTGQTSYCPDPILRHFTYLDTKHTKPNSILILLPYLRGKIQNITHTRHISYQDLAHTRQSKCSHKTYCHFSYMILVRLGHIYHTTHFPHRKICIHCKSDKEITVLSVNMFQ